MSHMFVLDLVHFLALKDHHGLHHPNQGEGRKNKTTLERQMEEWKIMAKFPKRHNHHPGEQERESGTCTACSELMLPLVLFFSLPSVSFPQLQSLPCLCCQYDLANGNTQSYTSWDWSANSGEMIMPELQQHACWVGVPYSCSPLN